MSIPFKLVLDPVNTAYLGLDARKPVFAVCNQKRRRPAWASAQSDQRLYYSLIGKCYKAEFQFSYLSRLILKKINQ